MPARQRLRLTDRSLRKKGPGRHGDGDGLILQVTKSGSRSWILRTMVHGKRTDIGLGGWPLVSLKEARDKAFELRKIARAGGNPLTARDKGKAPVPSFRIAAATAHKQHEHSWKNRKHAKQWISTLEQYVFPTLGDTPVDVVRSEHIVHALSPIWLIKPETARRVLQRVRTVLLWSKGNGHRPDSPTDEITAARKALPRQNERGRHHKALAYAEAPGFIRRLRGFSTSDPIKLAFEFLILTAARTNEVLRATWSEISLEDKVWTVPEERMKAGREHRVPLSDSCMSVLEAARKLNEDPEGFLFPGTKHGKPLSDMVFLMVLRRMGLDITAHGFRSSFRVWCAEQTSAPREVAEAALAHVLKDATEAAYLRSTFFEKRRQLMNKWAGYVAGAVAVGVEGRELQPIYV